jgi:hypothetical protein
MYNKNKTIQYMNIMNNKSNKKTSGKFILLQKLAEFGHIDDKICGLCISTMEKVPILTKTKIENLSESQENEVFS